MSAPAIHVEGLHVVAAGRQLLQDASLSINKGELCLLVGGSGTGKSITLGLLSGLRASEGKLEIRGEISVLGQRIDPARTAAAGVQGAGVVFQDFALFDDLHALDNVRFGYDHAKIQHPDRTPKSLLQELGLPRKTRPAHLSGGMRQRLAIARALAFGPELLFYDEPTSGLDPAMSRKVASILRSTHDQHGMTSVIVTHDLGALATIADRIIFLDPVHQNFREVPKEELDQTLAALAAIDVQDPDPPPTRFAPFGKLADLLVANGRAVRAAGNSLKALLPLWPRTGWGLSFFWHYFRLLALGSALPFLALAGLIGGFVTTYFLFGLLPFRGFTEPVLAEEFVGSLGFALYRVLIPGLVTLLFAARAGAAIAADTGNRVLTRQVDALRSHGVAPERYLLTGTLWASLIGIPFLFLAADFCSRTTALAVFLAQHPGHGAVAFDEHFQKLLGGDSALFPRGYGWVLAKILTSAFGSAAIAWHLGMRPKTSGSEVANGVTAAIIRTTVFVLLVHMVFAFFEFQTEV